MSGKQRKLSLAFSAESRRVEKSHQVEGDFVGDVVRRFESAILMGFSVILIIGS
jgi:hypothetical protein